MSPFRLSLLKLESVSINNMEFNREESQSNKNLQINIEKLKRRMRSEGDEKWKIF